MARGNDGFLIFSKLHRLVFPLEEIVVLMLRPVVMRHDYLEYCSLEVRILRNVGVWTGSRFRNSFMQELHLVLFSLRNFLS